MGITIDALTRFPVKGLSGESLESVLLESGKGFPCDRQFGFARANSGFDPNDPKPLPKSKFFMLARDAHLALLSTHYDDETGVLLMSAPQDTGRFDITTSNGRQNASEFLKSYLSLSEEETPHLVEASPHRFTDVSVISTEMMNAVSIINLDSVSDFSKTIAREVDPQRFRGNIHISGLPPFSELEMVEQHIAVGTIRFKIVKRIMRCPATEVNLDTGERDMKTPRLLREHYRHMDMGVYAEVVQGGVISKGDKVEFL